MNDAEKKILNRTCYAQRINNKRIPIKVRLNFIWSRELNLEFFNWIDAEELLDAYYKYLIRRNLP